MPGTEHINNNSVTHSGSSEVLPEDVRREYLQAMGIQPWYDPAIKLESAPIEPNTLDVSATSSILQDDVVSSVSPSSNSEQKIEDHAAVDKVASEAVVQTQPVSPASLDSNISDISQLHEVVQSCHLCELHATRKQAIGGEGNASADLMIVISSPVVDASGEDVLFSSAHKAFLQLVLQAIDISLPSVYLTSLVKCQPPEQRQPYTSEVICCDEHLTNQIKVIKPEVIMVLGEQASQQLLVSQKSLTDLRLRHHQHLGVPVYASYHPEEIIDSVETKRKVWQDLLQIKKQLNKRVET